jgi:hypothetical protein
MVRMLRVVRTHSIAQHTHSCMHIQTRVDTHASTHTYTHTCTHTYTYTHTHTHIHTRVDTHTCTHTHTHSQVRISKLSRMSRIAVQVQDHFDTDNYGNFDPIVKDEEGIACVCVSVFVVCVRVFGYASVILSVCDYVSTKVS